MMTEKNFLSCAKPPNMTQCDRDGAIFLFFAPKNKKTDFSVCFNEKNIYYFVFAWIFDYLVKIYKGARSGLFFLRIYATQSRHLSTENSISRIPV